MPGDFVNGEVINNEYKIMNHIGSGGYSDVYKAQNLRHNRIVAVKHYRLNMPGIEEMKILKDLRHNYLPQVYDIIRYKNSDLLIMEYVDGTDMLTYIQQNGNLLPEIANRCVLQLCDVVGYLHLHNPQIIHGDIKPNNIIMRKSGDICLIDYNLSQAFNRYMFPIGRTNGYSPPEFYSPQAWEAAQYEPIASTAALPIPNNEQATYPISKDTIENGIHILTCQSDVYSIGATLYYCITARHPWPHNQIRTSLLDHHIGKIVSRCMEFSPKIRFPSTKLLANAIQCQVIYEYDVALSFAGDNRDYVRQVAFYLDQKCIKVFYDELEKENLWGKNLYQYLDVIYQRRARYCIVFISESYAKNLWTKHEIQSVFARAFAEESEYYLPVIFDDTQLPGLRITTGYLDARVYKPSDIAELFIKKLTGTQPN